MEKQNKPISTAIEELKNNLFSTARVCEWGRLMGYKNPKRFARKFLRYHEITPQKMLEHHRLKSVIHHLRTKSDLSNFEIARLHSMLDEKALNNFTNYHLGLSPTELKEISENEIQEKMEILGSKIQK